MHSSRSLYPVLMLRGVKIVANSTLMVLQGILHFMKLVKIGQLELLASNVTLDQHVSAVRRPYPAEGRTHRARPRAQSSCNTWSTPHPAAVVANRRALPTSTVAPKKAGSSKASGTASSTI